MITIDDERLTAYALGEMTDAERVAFEAELAELQAADPTAKAAIDAEIDSIRAVATTLTGELKAETAVAWATSPSSPSTNDGLVARATTGRMRIGRWVLAAAAAVVVGGIAFSLLPEMSPARMSSRDVALARTQRQGAIQDQERVGSKAEPLASGWKQVAAQSPLQSSPSGPAAGTIEVIGGSVLSQRGPTLNGSRITEVDAAGKAALPSLAPGISPRQYPLFDKNSAGLVAKDADGDGIADAGLSPVVAASLGAGGRGGQRALERQKLDDEIAALQSEISKNVADSGKFKGTNQADDKLVRLREKLRDRDEVVGDSNNLAESYAAIHDNTFLDPRSSPLSTFGIDVDTASYANVRRYLESGQRPPADAVRIEELVNYFPTHDAPPTDGLPFAVRMEVAACPWSPEHRLVRVGIKGKVIEKQNRPPSNLVFLVDVSGSMNEPNKLPLVKRSLRKLVGQLGENDRVAIVVYAGNSGLALPSTNASDKTTILNAIDKLEAGGSTNGGQGIELAYSTAMEHLAKDAGSNRVILCTDGDFNVGVVDRGQLFDLIAQKAKAGVFLNVLGFGTGNTKDDTMEGLADKGNGQYGYIDSDREADKVFVEGLSGTLVTIAKDVKLQLEFNPATVKSYRLIGYENRVMAAQDFNNDLKDSGDLGAGHNVVALYEIDPTRGIAPDSVKTEPALKYQPAPKTDEATRLVAPGSNTTELLTLKLRYKRPDAPLEQGTSDLIETSLEDRTDASIGAASEDLRFAAAVAGFGMMLRDSPNRGACTWEMIRSLARGATGDDVGGHRSEFLNLIDAAQNARP